MTSAFFSAFARGTTVTLPGKNRPRWALSKTTGWLVAARPAAVVGSSAPSNANTLNDGCRSSGASLSRNNRSSVGGETHAERHTMSDSRSSSERQRWVRECMRGLLTDR